MAALAARGAAHLHRRRPRAGARQARGAQRRGRDRDRARGAHDGRGAEQRAAARRRSRRCSPAGIVGLGTRAARARRAQRRDHAGDRRRATTGSCGAPGSASAATPSPARALATLAAAAGRRRARRRGHRRRAGRPRARRELQPGLGDAERGAAGRARDRRRTRAGAFDVGSACTGFLAALAAARGMLASGAAPTALVIGAEIMSRHVDPGDRNTAALFGDGAGAIVCTAGGAGALGPVVLGADGAHARPDRRRPATRSCSRWTATRPSSRRCAGSPRSPDAAAGAAGVALDDIDLFVYHQANTRILASLADRLGARARPRRRRDRRRSATPPRRACRWRSSAARRDGRLAPGHARPARRRRLGLHLGRERRRMGARAERRADGRLRAGDRRLARDRRGDRARARAPTAGRSRSTTAAAPRRRAATVAAIEAAGGRAVALAGDVADPAAPAALLDGAPRRRSAARCSRSSTTPACAPTASRCRSATRTGGSCSTPTSARPTG